MRPQLAELVKLGFVRGDESDKELARLGITLRPAQPCPTCGTDKWWHSSVAGWCCWDCRPPASIVRGMELFARAMAGQSPDEWPKE